MLDGDLPEFRTELIQALSQTLHPAALMKMVQTFADNAGKESAAKKVRLRDAFAFSHSFFRQLMLAGSGAAEMTPALRAWPYGADAATRAIELCLEAGAAVDANASPANVLEWWADELATLQRTGQAVLLGAGD